MFYLRFIVAVGLLLATSVELYSEELSPSSKTVESLDSAGARPQNYSPEQLQEACLQAESNPSVREQLLALPLSVEADDLVLQEGTAIYEGNVRVEHNCILLEAGNASLDIEEQVVRLTGDVHMELPLAELDSAEASFSLEDNSSSLSAARYRIDAEPPIYGGADLMALNADRSVLIEGGSYTRCEPDDKDWEVTASKIRLNPQTGQGSARNAVVKIAKTPVLYVPYMRFPIGDQRQSGFLFPELTSRSEGIDLVVPYYFNLGPNYDLLFRPRYKSGSGYITEFSSRWLNRWDSWQLDGMFIDSDKDFGNDSRWLFHLSEASYHSGHWKTELDISRSSDEDVLRDLQTNNFSTSRSSALASTGSVRWLDEWGELGLAIEQYQSIDPLLEIPSEKQPEFWINAFIPSASYAPNLLLDASMTVFDSQELADITGEERASRVTGELYAFYPYSVGFVDVELGAGSDYRHYSLESSDSTLLNGEDSASVVVPFAGLDLQSSFYKRSSRVNESKNSTLNVLTPRISYRARFLESGEEYLSSMPVFDSAYASTNILQWYSDSTSVGGDFIETRDSLRSSLRYSARTGQQQFNTELGLLNYFSRTLANDVADAPSIQNGGLSSRQWLLSSDWRYGGQWSARMDLLFSAHDDELDYASTSIQYRGAGSGANKSLSPLVNLAYHYRRDDARFVDAMGMVEDQDVELADISTSLPIDSNWGFLARFQYDLEHNRASETLAGLEFDDCCVKFRLVYREGIIYDADSVDGKRDRAIVAQVQLKGLGGVGRAVDTLLESSIRGFRAN